MKIILTNQMELIPIMVTGETKYIQNSSRDALTFVFSDEYSMDELDALFTENACEIINIIGNDDSEAIYTGYTIRAELTKKEVEIQKATETTDAVFEKRIFVTMAQRTYAESKLAALEAAIDLLSMEDMGGII